MLIGVRLRGLANAVGAAPGRWIAATVFLGAVYLAIYHATRRALRFLDGYPAIGTIADAVAQRSLEALFVLLMLGVAFSVLTTAVGTLYDGADLPFLLALPLEARRVFELKVAETYLGSALLPCLFTFPVLLAIGAERAAPATYYPVAVLATLALYAIPVALGALLALLLMRLSPAGRVREVANAVSVGVAAAVIFGLRALRPERLTALTPEQFEVLLANFARFDVGWSPTSWASRAVWRATDGGLPPSAVLLALASLALLWGVARVAAFAYRQGWMRSLEQRRLRLDPSPLPPARWERPLARFGPLGGVVVKDLRLLARDPNQWSQLLVLVALGGVYLVSAGAVDIGVQRFRDAVGALNVMFLGFLLAGVGIRTAFPAVSLEGEGFWLLRSGPIRASRIVLAKFLAALPPMVLLGGALGFAAARLIDVSAPLVPASPIAGICAAFATTGLGVGLGAAFPRFDATSPAEIPVSPGGLLYMACSLLYAALLTVLLAYPAYQIVRRGDAFAWTDPGGWLVIALAVTVTALATVLPLWFGSARLAAEDRNR